MVYCAKRGTQNDDDVAHCTKCGEPLRTTQRDSRNWEEKIAGGVMGTTVTIKGVELDKERRIQ